MSEKQTTIFDPAYRASIQAEQNKETGMMLAVAHAEDHIKDWADRAGQWIKIFLDVQGNKPFMCEDFREFTLKSGFDQPPHQRAFGWVIRKAARDGLIVSVGYGQTSNPNAHRAVASYWKKND